MKAAILLAPLALGVTEPTLVPDVSERRIEIAYSFTGAELLLFGAILYPGGHPPDPTTQVAIVVRGPSQPLIVREKARVAGVWVNHDSVRFAAVPAFYAVASATPLDQLVDPRAAARYGLGIANLRLGAAGTPAHWARFADGLVALRRASGLYAEHAGAVSLRQGVLYRAAIPIPARVPVGRYSAETFLIHDGRVIAVASRRIDIRKSGFERFVARAAVEQPLLYGLAAIAMSLALGWLAAFLFRRRAR